MSKPLLALAMAALCTGCTAPYKLPEGVPAAKLNVGQTLGTKWICENQKARNLAADADGYARIPAGSRVTIGSNYYNYVYQGTSTYCNPRSSIVPEAGKSYYVDFQIEAERCFTLLFLEDPSSRTGLALDPTFRTSSECASAK